MPGPCGLCYHRGVTRLVQAGIQTQNSRRWRIEEAYLWMVQTQDGKEVKESNTESQE